MKNNQTIISAQRKDNKRRYYFIIYLSVCKCMPFVPLLSHSRTHHKLLITDCSTFYHSGLNITSPDSLNLLIGFIVQDIICFLRSFPNQYFLLFPSISPWREVLMKWIYLPTQTCHTDFNYYNITQNNFFTKNIYSLIFVFTKILHIFQDPNKFFTYFMNRFWAASRYFLSPYFQLLSLVYILITVNLLFCFVLFKFYWGIVDLQCSVSFYCTAKWISYLYTYIPSFLDFLPI